MSDDAKLSDSEFEALCAAALAEGLRPSRPNVPINVARAMRDESVRRWERKLASLSDEQWETFKRLINATCGWEVE